MLNYWRSVDNARIYYLHLAVDHILIHLRRWSTLFLYIICCFVDSLITAYHWCRNEIKIGRILLTAKLMIFFYFVPAVCFSRTFFMWSTKKWLLFINAFTHIFTITIIEWFTACNYFFIGIYRYSKVNRIRWRKKELTKNELKRIPNICQRVLII